MKLSSRASWLSLFAAGCASDVFPAARAAARDSGSPDVALGFEDEPSPSMDAGVDASGPSPYAWMFEPSDQDAGLSKYKVLGLWSRTAKSGAVTRDVRLHLRADRLSMAARCSESGASSPIVGITVTAIISGNSFDVTQSDSATTKIGAATCEVSQSETTLPACISKLRNCFDTYTGQLIFYGPVENEAEAAYTKLSD